MQQAHMWIDALDDFTVQLHHHAKHAMGSRMLRAKVDGVILNLDFVGNRGITLRQFFRCGRHDFFPSSALTGDGAPGASGRSEERRGGKEWFSTCRSRWWRYH